MSGLFVKLDAEYPTDDEFIEAGPTAELLYIRGLCFCKRKMLDGTISRTQLPAVSLGIPSAKRAANALVSVGLWQETDEGWYITAWLKRNKSAQKLAEEKEARQQASAIANHDQHHVGPGKKRSARCEICLAERSVIGSDQSPKSEPKPEQNRTRRRLQEEEPEPEEEPEEEKTAPSTLLRPASGTPEEIQETIHRLSERFRA